MGMGILFDPGAHHVISIDPTFKAISVSVGKKSLALDAIDEFTRDSRAVYWCINPVSHIHGDHPVRIDDMLRYVWLVIDCDRSREIKQSTGAGKLMATQKEKDRVFAMSTEMVTWLNEQGWPKPVVLDSGNGAHLYYRIALEATRESRELLSKISRALGQKFNNPDAEVDPAFIWRSKLPGTWVRRGPQIEERPHRLCRIVSAPRVASLVPQELLEAVAALWIKPERRKPSPRLLGSPGTNGTPYTKHRKSHDTAQERNEKYLDRAIEDEVAKVASSVAGHRNAPLNEAAFNLGSLCDYPGYNRNDIEWQLQMASEASGHDASSARGTIRSGLDAGEAKARAVPEHAERNGTVRHGSAIQPSITPEEQTELERDYRNATDIELGITDSTEIEVENPEWLWRRRFFKNKINLIAGEGGEGKTTVAIAVAAVVINGGIFPDGTPVGEPGRVLMLAAEDGAGDTLKPRFIAAGAQLKPGSLKFLDPRVCIPKKGDRPAMVSPISLSDLTYWRVVFARERPTLLIIDPLPAYLGRGVNDHRNNEVQEVLNAFSKLVTEFSVCVIAITHTGKATDRKLIHKILGTVAYGNSARAVHITVQDPDDPSIRYLERPKCNNDEKIDALQFQLVSAEFEYEGKTFKTSKAVIEAEAIAIDAEAMVKPNHKHGSVRGPQPKKEIAAAEWLYDFLETENGRVELKVIIAAAGAADLIGKQDPATQYWSNLKMLYRAKDRLELLEGEREGMRIDEEKMKGEQDRYPRKFWRLVAN
jgi:hypothetical protein